jgi:hypothetical protein
MINVVRDDDNRTSDGDADDEATGHPGGEQIIVPKLSLYGC